MTRFYFFWTFLTTTFLTTNCSYSQTTVKIDQNCQRFIGGVSALDRTKFFSIHDASNDTEAAIFRNEYNVTGGRSFWGAFSYAKNQTGSVGVYPPDRVGNDDIRPVLEGFVATEHPRSAFVDGLNVEEAADWAVAYYQNFVDQSGRQEYFEVMNEPFVHASDFYSGGWSISEEDRIKLQMAQLYNEVGKKISTTPSLANMKVIGYSSAWPSMELNDFSHWEENMKMFMDVAGENMYAFSTHFYDGINVSGQDNKRSGSNSEAILDLIENYSKIKWGVVKPHAITEYGAIEHGYGDDYSDLASAQTMISLNHILFSLLDREDRVEMSIPFITGKATWHINAENNYQPYQAVLWKPTNIGEPTPAGWEYTPRINFYKLWKEVKGKRVYVNSDNPDIQVQAFVDGAKMYLALSNLDETTQNVDLSMLSTQENLDNVVVKALKVYAQTLPEFTEQTVHSAPASISLIKDETVVLEYSYTAPIEFDNAFRSSVYYPSNYLETITANSEIKYEFNDINTGDGNAVLRMSIGRKHDKTKKPIVKVNGVQIEVPDNWKGYDQANRDDFFGMIEIPFSSHLLDTNNSVSITFPDNGGRISSLLMQVGIYDTSAKSLIIKGIGSSCPDSNDGSILIESLISDSYQVNVMGEGLDSTFDFTSDFSIDQLAAGQYTVEITSTTNPDLREIYTIVISEPDVLGVSSKINSVANSVNLKLSGGTIYKITHDGVQYATDQNEITLNLNKGKNKFSIKTDKDCQGTHEEVLFIGDNVSVYPNPSHGAFEISIPIDFDDSPFEYEIYSSIGELVLKGKDGSNAKSILLDLSTLANGMYFFKMISAKSNLTAKIIKR